MGFMLSLLPLMEETRLSLKPPLEDISNSKIQKVLVLFLITYSTPTLTNKLFNNIRRASKGYSGVVTPLFDIMLVQPQGEAPSTSPSRIISSPSLSSHHTTCSTPTTPPSIQITYKADETTTMPHDSPLPGGHTPGSDEVGLESKEIREASQEDIETQEKNSADTEVLLEETTLTKLIEDLGNGEKGEKEISTDDVTVSTAGAEVSTASHDVSTVAAALVYIRRSASKAKDKGKAIMQEPKPPKKLKKMVQTIDWSDPAMLSRKKSLARKRAYEKQSEESTKRQKIEDDVEKEELKAYLDLVPREEFAMEIESLATKYPIVDWKTHVLTENFMYYQILRADGSFKNYKIFSEMLDNFDKQDILFKPNEEDEVWRNQHEYNLISWRLFDSRGIHILLINNGIAIHMMIEKKYPLTQEMLSKMLSRKLKVDHENEMAFELLRFIRS
ncbi:hypothetical protein Tco_1399559 [Tanacetum coccineum]